MMRTFEQWSNAGFLINKGEKAKMRDERGTPLFDNKQVSKKPASKSRYRQGFSRRPSDPDEAHQVMMEDGWPSMFPDDDIPF